MHHVHVHLMLIVYVNEREEIKPTRLNENTPAGVHQVQFEAGNLASGIYLYRMQTGSFTDVKKLVLLR